MKLIEAGAIDCDIHPALGNTDVLLPYLDDFWRQMVPMRTVEQLDLSSYPPNVPLAGRADWRPKRGKPGSDFAMVKLTPAQQRQLVRSEPEAFRPVKGAWGVKGATQVFLESAEPAVVRGALVTAWKNVAPKGLADAFDESRDEEE